MSATAQPTDSPDKGKGKATDEPQDVSMGEGDDSSESEAEEVSKHLVPSQNSRTAANRWQAEPVGT